MKVMFLYSLPVLRVNVAEGDSVVRVVASEEKPETQQTNKEHYRYICYKNIV